MCKNRLTSANEYSCRRHEKCSTYQKQQWQVIEQRGGGQKLRYSPTVLKESAAPAHRTAILLAKECGRLSGNALSSALPATGSPKRGRSFLLDSGASFNIIGRDELTRAELKTIRKCKIIRLNTAGGILQCDHIVTVYVADLDVYFYFLVFPSCQPVLSMGCMADGDCEFSWRKMNGFKTMRIHQKDGTFVECFLRDCVPRLYNMKDAGSG